MQHFPNSGGKQRPIGSTLVHAIIPAVLPENLGVVHGYDCRDPVSASVVMNEMRRLVAPGQPIMLNVPDMLKLQIEPLADCGRYDHLREVSHVVH